jgi:hypothetical protein
MSTEGKRKQPLTAYNVFILIFIGLGSVSYGYAAAIIGQTLGMWSCDGNHLSFSSQC